MSFRNIANAFLAENLDMVPGLIFGRTALGHGFIPFLGTVEFGVDTQNHPVIIEFFVVDQLPHAKFGSGFLHNTQ